MNNLAWMYKNQNQWDEAEALEAKVVGVRKKTLSVEHPDTLTSMNNLAFTWKRLDRNAEAIDLMRECVQLR
ncbi:hypothetical protein GQ44DRAFT_602347 [Phaeosphaeriaceae sp. PMI808]|nr:hypothetical protein GQ44DRAFT_602347 [Phaeosphaeriaceae sp. PMI808]